jgi:predicted DsbA family dithiol-disulfide isomerase
VRLDELLAEEGDDITVEWRSFLLRPAPEERDLAEFTTYTKKWARPADMEPRASFSTPWSGENDPPSHSLPSAVAAKVVEKYFPDSFDDFHHKLMKAYFIENRTVSDRSVLIEVAGAAGIDGDEFARHYDDEWQPLARAAYEDHNEAIGSGINGVPAVVVDGQYLVSGAVDVDHYRQVLAQVRAAQES